MTYTLSSAKIAFCVHGLGIMPINGAFTRISLTLDFKIP